MQSNDINTLMFNYLYLYHDIKVWNEIDIR